MKFLGEHGTDINTISGCWLRSPEHPSHSTWTLHPEVSLLHLPQTLVLITLVLSHWYTLSPGGRKYLNGRNSSLLFPYNCFQLREGTPQNVPSPLLASPLSHQGTQGKIRHRMTIPGHDQCLSSSSFYQKKKSCRKPTSWCKENNQQEKNTLRCLIINIITCFIP